MLQINNNIKEKYDTTLQNYKDNYKTNIDKIIIGAVIILFEYINDPKILLLKRSKYENFFPGIYEIPGGHVEDNETIIESIVRETKEETNLNVISIDEEIISFQYENKRGKISKQLNFLVTIDNNKIIKLNPEEHDEYIWCSKSDIDKYNITPSMKTVIIDAFFKIELKLKK